MYFGHSELIGSSRKLLFKNTLNEKLWVYIVYCVNVTYVTCILALHLSCYIRVLIMKLAYKQAVISPAKSCPDNTCYESSVKTFSSMSALNVHFSPLVVWVCMWVSMCMAIHVCKIKITDTYTNKHLSLICNWHLYMTSCWNDMPSVWVIHP